MSDLFDLLVQEEMNPDLQIRPVIEPLFPLFVPERWIRVAPVVPTFRAETRTTDTSLIQRDEPDTATRLQVSILRDKVQPQVPSERINSAALPDSVGVRDDDKVRERNASEESSVIIPTNAAALRDHALRDHAALAENSASQSEASAPIMPDDGRRAKSPRAIQPQPEVERAADINPAIIDTARPAPMRLNVPAAPPVVPNTVADEWVGPPPDSVSLPSVGQQPEIRIGIGRIEVRVAEPPPANKTKQTKPNVPRLSLDDYLRSRSGGG